MKDGLEQIRAVLAEVSDPAALLEGFFTYAPVGLQIYKANGTCLLVNPAFVRLFGTVRPPEYNVLEDEIAREHGVLELIHRAFRGETIALPPIWYDPRDLKQVKIVDGRGAAIAATFFPLFDRAGAVTHVAIVFRDATAEMLAHEQTEAERDELLRRESERERDEQFRELLFWILGHDLRSPLSAIVASVGLLLRRGDMSERNRQVVLRIANASERMRRMISDLLDFARTRLGEGVLPISRASADVAAIVSGAVDELRLAHPHRELVTQVRGDCAASVDADRIAQLAVNLAENALRHAEEGTAIALRVNGEDPARVMIEVENRGPPIPPEDRKIIFELYRRGRARTRERARSLGAGLGLGLYIVREIARAHGGEATVDSSSEAGTVFRIVLPREGPDPSGK